VLGKIPQSVGKYRRAWEKMSESVGKCRKPKEGITEGTGKIVKKYREGGNISEERKLSIGILILINDNVRKLACSN
jgi:hypothetical protein